MALEGKRLALRNAQRSEKTPAVEQSGLAGRKANVPDRQKTMIVKDVAMNHRELSGVSIFPLYPESEPLHAANADRKCDLLCAAEDCVLGINEDARGVKRAPELEFSFGARSDYRTQKNRLSVGGCRVERDRHGEKIWNAILA